MASVTAAAEVVREVQPQLRIVKSDELLDAISATSHQRSQPEVKDAVLRKDAAEVNKQKLETLAKDFNNLIDTIGKSLRVSVHEGTNTITVKIVDNESGQVIREIPPSKFLDMVSNLEKLMGFIVDAKV